MLASLRRNVGRDAPEWLRQLVAVLADNFDQLARLGVGDSVIVRRVSFLAATARGVNHTLARIPRGWRVVRSRGAAARLYESLTTEPTDRQVTLTSETTCIADLEFW